MKTHAIIFFYLFNFSFLASCYCRLPEAREEERTQYQETPFPTFRPNYFPKAIIADGNAICITQEKIMDQKEIQNIVKIQSRF